MEISDLESTSGSDKEGEGGDGSGKGKKNKKGKRGKDEDDDDYGTDIPGETYDRTECFKVEKLLLVYGWGIFS